MNAPAPRATEPAVAGTPGEALRAAREARGLTVEAVAAQLRLEPPTVMALETGRSEALPGPAYARGYVRSYARLVGLDPALLLERFDIGADAAPPALKPMAGRRRPQARSGDRPVKLVTYLLAAAIVVLPVLWWQSRQAGAPLPGFDSLPGLGFDDPAPTPVAAPAPAVAMPSTLGYAYPVIAHPDGPLAPAATGTLAPAATLPAGPLPAPPPSEPGMFPGAVAPGAPAGTLPAVAQVAVVAGKPLVLGFDGESWVEVYDAAGARLYFNRARAGQTLELDGTPPLRLLLGNAAAVRLRWQGADLDLAPWTNEGVARLTLGASGAGAP